MSELLKWGNLMYNLANGISRLILAITFRVLYKLDLLAGLIIFVSAHFLVFAFYVALGGYCAMEIMMMLESGMGILGILIGTSIVIPMAFFFWGAILFTQDIVMKKLKFLIVRT